MGCRSAGSVEKVMGIMDFSSGETEETKQENETEDSSDNIDEDLKTKRFLRQYDPHNFEYRGSKPPSVFETNVLEGYWEDEWVDKTGEWEHAPGLPELPEKEFVRTECPCGNTVSMPLMARHTRCGECHRVLINKEWEDDRVKNPNLGGSDIEDFM